MTPGEFLAQSTEACGVGGHDHAASYSPILRREMAVSYKRRERSPA